MTDTTPVAADARTAHRLARAALSRLAEPQDVVAGALIAVAGPVDALRVATGAVRSGPRLERAVADQLGRHDDGPALVAAAVQRWAARVPALAPERDLTVLDRLGGWLLTPEDEAWPAGLADLGPEAPLCLWGRGQPADALPATARAVAVVGARDSTAYGEAISADLAHGLVSAGCTVVSGGAFGIDAQAHRGALAAHGSRSARDAANRAAGPAMPTVAVMACGVDRFYPAAHETLLRAVLAEGCLLAEVPPGSSPTRWRFLQRNRLIAALSGVTVVVEARWRSGALNTAHHAAGLGREVGAVPGSVHASTSAGCHRLLRESDAVCVTDVEDVLALLDPFRLPALPAAGQAGRDPDESTSVGPPGNHPPGVALPVRSAPPAAHDGLSAQDLILYDALPMRTGSTTARLASVAGLSEPMVRAGLGRLSLRGLAVTMNGSWRKGGATRG
ncbi:DNA processing protein DprA [Tersicoccus solisilvae]|uniref:DNA processing protein DprA n=1 Tax=Tersicoccus solisilvae TaxID=1882339 RepID=A0ABQ1PDM8_9MICC|nr:DNA-processing protein DprA [Tersicoccus solisilvae]GGC95153.1 DNA processing protein DprA [Tersicoccus solisilvae]